MTGRPLEGVKVLELAIFIAAPSCTRYLADLGAEVIQVEAAGGDSLRFTGLNEGRPFGDAEDTTFTLENTGKQAVVLNLKSEAGREAFDRLLARSDVFVTNWRAQALQRAGLDYETLKAKHPALVMGLVSGYGEKGPDKDLPGFDFTAFFARGGVLGTMYDRASQPMMPIAGFGDHPVAVFLASGILAALYRAKTTGVGDQVTVSLYQTALWMIAVYLQANQYGDATTQYPVRRQELPNQLQVAHKTADDRWIQIAMPAYDKFISKFLSVIGHPDPEDPRFVPQANALGHLDELYDIVRDAIAGKTLAEWSALLTEADLPFSPCYTWAEILADEQAWANDYLAWVEFPNGAKRAMVRPPVTFADTPLPPYERGPFLGEHTEQVLASLGYSPDQIQAMIAAGDAAGLRRIG
jgi:cinnamoyl-CoA:phenyllactate CoA-transferase